MIETAGKTKPTEKEPTILRILESAITSTLGSIDALPDDVLVKLREVYREFIPAYLEMIRIRDNQPREWHPEKVVIESDVVEGMGHFYSDYQQLARRFQDINRKVKYLMVMDRKADPHRYDEVVENIVSGKGGLSVMSSLLESE